MSCCHDLAFVRIVVDEYSPLRTDYRVEVYPVGAPIPDNLDELNESIEDWIAENQVRSSMVYEIVMKRVVEHDGGGAITDIYWEPIYQQSQVW